MNLNFRFLCARTQVSTKYYIYIITDNKFMILFLPDAGRYQPDNIR